MIRVDMVVWNDFQNDARVLKEAETLGAAGYDVTIHALHVPGLTSVRERLGTRIKIVRVSKSPVMMFFKMNSGPRDKSALVLQQSHSSLGAFVQAFYLLGRAWAHLALAWNMIRNKPDVVHGHDVNTLPTAWFVAKVSGARLIYDAHEISTSREGYSNFRKLVGVVEKALMPRANGTVTTTEARAKFFARAYAIKRPVVLQNRPRQQPCTQSNRIREELELSQPWPIIVYQGGVQSGRGLERLARVAANVPNAYFVFIGGGRLDGSLRSIVSELGLEERVRFISTVPLADLPSYTASADIGVQPIENTCLNHYTTDSNKLFEYVQAGLPIVASDLPEIRRVVRAHDLGLLVPNGDSEALTMALNELVADEGKRKYYAAQSREAAAVLNWESQEHELLALYDRVLSDSALA